MNSSRYWIVGSLGGWLALLAIIVCGMFWTRERVLDQYSTPESIAAWQAWRNDVRQQQSTRVPVERKVPKSEEPPVLVLMRDYFVVSLIGAAFFTSLLYGVTAWFVVGALRGNKPTGS